MKLQKYLNHSTVTVFYKKKLKINFEAAEIQKKLLTAIKHTTVKKLNNHNIFVTRLHQRNILLMVVLRDYRNNNQLCRTRFLHLTGRKTVK